MKKIFTFLIIAAILTNCTKKDYPTCKIKTSEGDIIIELYNDKAPKTVANFLRYVDNNYYEKSQFFRVCTPENESDRDIKIEVIQGGKRREYNVFEPIEIETTEQTGIKHLDGTVSMARDKPNSATQSFFICINDQPELDYNGKRNPDGQGFAAFGKVIQGMDVVKKIQSKKNKNQFLIQPVIIENIKRIE